MSAEQVHPIEAESYRRLRAAVDLSGWPPLSRSVAERIIHASADPGYAAELMADEAALQGAVDALADGAPVLVDAEMVAAGVSGPRVRCALSEPGAGELAEREGLTRGAAGMRLALDALSGGAVCAVGCAPTALHELVESAESARVEPVLVVGLPVGFVGAAEAKAALRGSGLAAISNTGPKGGSAVAAAAVNALLRAAGVHRGPRAGGDAGGG
jgi:precorrin-8X/cobalt-precorrin-8 methylmutase